MGLAFHVWKFNLQNNRSKSVPHLNNKLNVYLNAILYSYTAVRLLSIIVIRKTAENHLHLQFISRDFTFKSPLIFQPYRMYCTIFHYIVHVFGYVRNVWLYVHIKSPLTSQKMYSRLLKVICMIYLFSCLRKNKNCILYTAKHIVRKKLRTVNRRSIAI